VACVNEGTFGILFLHASRFTLIKIPLPEHLALDLHWRHRSVSDLGNIPARSVERKFFGPHPFPPLVVGGVDYGHAVELASRIMEMAPLTSADRAIRQFVPRSSHWIFMGFHHPESRW
jgi:hypothetical protein